MKAYLKRARAQIERDLIHSPERRYFSPALYSQYQVTLPLIQKHAHGRFIDLGCGEMPYREFVEGRVEVYDSFDVQTRTSGVTYVGDIQNMQAVPSASYDSAACLEVLEHVPDPFQAAREIFRILRPGGVLVLSVPHLSRLHEEPNDFYRYTRYGVRRLLEQAGFQVDDVYQRGSLFSFLGHQASTMLLGLAWPVPLVRQAAWFINKWLITRGLYRFDRLIDHTGLYALGYTAVARKP